MVFTKLFCRSQFPHKFVNSSLSLLTRAALPDPACRRRAGAPYAQNFFLSPTPKNNNPTPRTFKYLSPKNIHLQRHPTPENIHPTFKVLCPNAHSPQPNVQDVGGNTVLSDLATTVTASLVPFNINPPPSTLHPPP